MSKLKPIGSEKLKGQEQINRILEIAKYKENLPNSINETARTDYSTKLVDGNVYYIVKEKMGYIIKKGLNESTLDYMEPMKNRVYYTSYSEALKKLNLVAKELNRVHNINEGISLFTEDKKYFLKNPNPAPQEEETPPPAPMPEPMAEPTPTPPAEPMDTEPPADPEMGMDADMPEEPSDEMPASGPDDAGEEGDVSFKMIQKLTGKLAQKIRDFQEKDEEITSKDAKYVVNSILSALADNLEDDDKDDIIAKLEGEEDEDMGDMGMGDEEMPEEEPIPEEGMGMEDENMPEEVGEDISGGMGRGGDEPKAEMGESEVNEKYVEAALKKIFKESKVDSVLSKYFVVNENEKKFQQQKKQNKQMILEQKTKSDKNQIVRLSETVKQKKVAIDVINSFPEMKFVGKTNKGNLVFEHNNKQLKVSPKGELL
jgi:hypothetical protein